jgi:hypothetical protein
MDKQAVLEQIREEGFKDEMEKIAAKLNPARLEKVMRGIAGRTGNDLGWAKSITHGMLTGEGKIPGSGKHLSNLIPNAQKYLAKGGKRNLMFSPKRHNLLREQAVQDLVYNPSRIVY